jgi:hypothetical protein
LTYFTIFTRILVMAIRSAVKKPYVAELKRIARLGARGRAAITRHAAGTPLAREARLFERLAATAIALEKASPRLPEAVVAEIGKAVARPGTGPGVAGTDEREALLAEALARGQAYRAGLLADPRLMLSSEVLAGRLGVTRMTVNNWRDDGRLLALRNAANDYRYPAWQVEEAIREAMPALLRALRGADPWGAYRFFTTVDGYLGRTPLEALRVGDTERVQRAARGFTER